MGSRSWRWLALVHFLLAGCGVFSQEDVPATLRAQNSAYATEIAALPTSASLRASQVAMTLEASRSELNELQSVNAQLLSTVAAGSSPTPARVVAVESGESAQGLMMEDSAQAQPLPQASGAATVVDGSGVVITQIATASSIRAADGCAETLQSVFSTSVNRIYITAVAQNLRAGVQIEGNWFNAGTLAATTNWVPTQDYPQLCIWFFISPTETPGLLLQPGQWSVSLSVNGQLVSEPIVFTIQ